MTHRCSLSITSNKFDQIVYVKLLIVGKKQQQNISLDFPSGIDHMPLKVTLLLKHVKYIYIDMSVVCLVFLVLICWLWLYFRNSHETLVVPC